jgi:SAM-dependent methyltransferase
MNSNTWDPAKLLQTSSSYWTACVLQTAVKLGIFTAISSESLPAERIARKINGDIDGVTRLLDALSAMDLLNKENDIYTNTEISGTYLSKDSPQYLGYLIMHHHCLAESWIHLDEAVIAGKSIREVDSNDAEETREYFLMGMFNSAMGIAPGLADTLDLSGCRSLLDLGGGPGTYAIHFCLKNPHLRAVIFDLPTTRPFAERTVERFNLSARIEFQPGDAVTDPIEGEYDVAWVSHLLHSEGPDACQTILNKATAALRPGGIILIHEFILDNTMDGPLFPAIFSLNMLLGPPEGRSYSEEELIGMLEHAGVSEIERLDFVGPTESGLLRGINK